MHNLIKKKVKKRKAPVRKERNVEEIVTYNRNWH